MALSQIYLINFAILKKIRKKKLKKSEYLAIVSHIFKVVYPSYWFQNPLHNDLQPIYAIYLLKALNNYFILNIIKAHSID